MTKIAINGFGRIGRLVFKQIIDRHPNLEVVAINDLTDSKTLAHLLKYDSLFGIYGKNVASTKNSISVDDNEIKIFAEKDPAELPWKELEIDVVLECTGFFRTIEGAKKHIDAGAKKVIISAPGKGEGVPSYLLGINEEELDLTKTDIMDMGSCTTNCLAPVAKVLDEKFKIARGFMTTIHSYTSDQRLLDAPHKDLRRARAAAVNIIPTTTGAAKAIGKALPQLEGKLDGIALRVPTATVSIVDLVCEVEKQTSTEEVNNAFIKASQEKYFQGIFAVEETPLVSSDYVGNSFSSIVDAPLTMVKDNLVKVVAWYDNECGYATRMAEFAELIGEKL
ncbi:type I glyceraldehyde-3-phosphate dehydrogenase [Candidatus Parcubacteria bacterium]|nr:type I glyceraldehyde-3-phosphate dehydrogenase [Candidatus Parcubacteria bacterium]